jgi:hypothetical protein
MAKKKTKSEYDADVAITPDSFFKETIEIKACKIGRADQIIGGEVVIGLPLRALALRVLIGNDVWPLSRFTELSGVTGSGKTALLCEIFRWHIGYAGAYQLCMAEPRDTPDLRYSILGYDTDVRFPMYPCASVEQYQAAAWKRVASCRKLFSQVGAMPFPLCLGIDSVCGVPMESAIEQVVKEGFAKPDFAREAQIIKTWLQVICGEIRVWPISLVVTNHLKETKNKQGITERRTLGGLQVGFSSTMKLRVKKIQDLEYVDHNARIMEIIHDKNSLSSYGKSRRMKIYMRWNYPEGRQVTWFDWHDASTDYLLSLEAGSLKNRVLDVISFTDNDVTRRRVGCPELGLKKSSYAEVSQALEDPQNGKMRMELDKIFHVTPRRAFQPGKPYCVQQQEAFAAGEIIHDDQSIATPLPGEEKPEDES